MSRWIVLPPPDVTEGKCDLCDNEGYLLVYRCSDGSRWKVCSDDCLISAVDLDDVAGVITPEERDEMSARRRSEMEREAA